MINISITKNFGEKGTFEAIKTLIKVEADSTRYVGLPIAMIRISKNNYEWIEKTDSCTCRDSIRIKEQGIQQNKHIIE
jgi:hypothetical protein